MILNIQRFGGRGASSSKSKTITYKTTNGVEQKVKLNGTFLLDLKDIGLEQIRGKEYNSRVEMFDYLEKQLPKGSTLDRRESAIWYDTGKVVNSLGSTYARYDVVTYKNKSNKKIGITMILGGSYKDKQGIYRAIRYF